MDVAVNAPGLWLPAWPPLASDTHKYARGSADVVGGWPMSGAGRLGALAAARVGAGVVRAIVPEPGAAIYAAAFAALIVRARGAGEALMAALSERPVDAVLLGPGAGTGSPTRADVEAVLGAAIPCVLDADALTVFTGDAGALGAAISGPCILTPHEGEFSRLFDPDGDRPARALSAAAATGAVVVLKGPGTLVAAPDGRVARQEGAPATLATAGSGDVLAGLITGLLAQGVPAFEAACAGVWIHAQAAGRIGPGLIADDLPGAVPAVLASLGR